MHRREIAGEYLSHPRAINRRKSRKLVGYAAHVKQQGMIAFSRLPIDSTSEITMQLQIALPAQINGRRNWSWKAVFRKRGADSSQEDRIFPEDTRLL
jgi:hypothetical protein